MGCLTAAQSYTGRLRNLQLTGDPAADAVLDENPLALLIGMLLDQQ